MYWFDDFFKFTKDNSDSHNCICRFSLSGSYGELMGHVLGFGRPSQTRRRRVSSSTWTARSRPAFSHGNLTSQMEEGRKTLSLSIWFFFKRRIRLNLGQTISNKTIRDGGESYLLKKVKLLDTGRSRPACVSCQLHDSLQLHLAGLCEQSFMGIPPDHFNLIVVTYV